MSISLKVVRMAALDCAASKRSATRRRSGVILTRSSRSPSVLGGGGSISAGFEAAPAPPSSTCNTSSLRIRPPAPLPRTRLASIELPSSTRRATVDTSAPRPSEEVTSRRCAGADPTAGSGAAAESGAGLTADVAAAVGVGLGGAEGWISATDETDPGVMLPKTSPTLTLSPSFRAIWVNFPATGEGTSTVTLSVSRTTSGSSTFAASPSFLFHLLTTASVIDSPSCGTVISTAMAFPSRKRFLDNLLLLHNVSLIEARRWARAFDPTHELEPHGSGVGGDQFLEQWEHVAPGAHVLWLFLHPKDFR